MNIVKFKDIYLTQENADYLTENEIYLFNKWFKGRYAYVVNWKWCVPIDIMTESEFIIASIVDDSDMNGCNCNDYYWDVIDTFDLEEYTMLEWEDISDTTNDPSIPEFLSTRYRIVIQYSKLQAEMVDKSTTSRINSSDLYKNLNKFVSDENITLDELKNFRSWLAENILNIKPDFKISEVEMLSYYKDDMFDQVIKSLSLFTTNNQPTVTYVNQKSCNCMTSNIKSNMTITNQCDAVSEYRRGIYNRMVELFSDYTYWIELGGFIAEFKRYIDGIISYNLPLYTSQYVNVFDDCTCASQTDALQQRGIRAMKNLSQALQYIIDNDVAGHKNFINTSLNVFASEYYEMMKWK